MRDCVLLNADRAGSIPRLSPRTGKLLVACVGLILCLSVATSSAAASSHVPTDGTPKPAAATSANVTSCPLLSLNPTVLDQASDPYSLDPAVDYSYSAWTIMEQVYQTLVLYNGSSSTTFNGVLADRWTISPDGRNYTFHIRTGVRFSNGDALSAYTMWFSLYRILATNQTPSFILSQNFWLPGITYYSPGSQQTSAYNYLLNALNTFDFENPSAAELAVMTAANQSFQVIDPQTFALHVGAGYLGPSPYTYLLATLATPVASAVDPAVIQGNGGVGGTNAWMMTHMIGTGPFLLSTYAAGTGYTLIPDPNYWAASAATGEPWNVALQPALASVHVKTQANPVAQVGDLASGAAAGIPTEEVTPTLYSILRADPCIATNSMAPVYGSARGGWWMYMDQAMPPFDNLSVRRAILHAIDYDQLISVAFGGNAERWVGPVPPGYPYYNPQAIAPIAFNLAQARAAMNQSPWPLPGGYPVPLKFEYPILGNWPVVAVLLQADLAKIGIQLSPIGVDIGTLFMLQTQDATGICLSETTYAGGPFYAGLDFWAADYLAPDDWTQADALSYGPANICSSRYANATVDTLVLEAASANSPATLAQDYAAMTQTMVSNATNAWLVVPAALQAYHPSLRGLVPNPMGQAADFALTFNTLHTVPPVSAQFSVNPSPESANASAAFVAVGSGGTPPYTFTWHFGDGRNATGLSADVNHTYLAPGNYTANLTVRDGYGGYSRTSLLLVVTAARVPPPQGIAPLVIVTAIGITAIAVVAIGIFLLVRRRNRRLEAPVPPGQNPPTPPPPSP